MVDLNSEIAKLLTAYNDYLLTHLGVSRRQQFLMIEQAHLSALPAENYEVKTYKRATVQKMGYIFLSEDKNYYSVPYRFISKRVEVSYNRHSIYIHYNKERIASHKRNFRPGRYTTIKDHLSSTHQFYRNWSPDFFQKLARPYGLAVEEYVKALIDFKDYPEVAYKQCLGIIALGKTLPPDRLNNACKRGLTSSRFGYHIIKNILHHKLDLHPPDLDTSSSHIEEHKNIRGASYYQ